VVKSEPDFRRGIVPTRRSSAGPAHLKCRNKGKAVIVRIGSIHTGTLQGIEDGPIARSVRKIVAIMALAASVAALGLIVESHYGQRLFGDPLQQPYAAQSAAGSGLGADATGLTPLEENRYRVLSEYVARRYRVSQDMAFDLVGLAHKAGRELQLDPLLIIAVISVESGFNPIAESVAGAKGLMQIIPKYHGDKLEEFGGPGAVFDPATNIQVGAQILKEYIRRTGNVGIGLQMYAGALGDEGDQYTNKVLGVKQRLQQVESQLLRGPAAAPIRTASIRSSPFTLPLD
jgi:soluble lytic murein transglycosylase-like protein